ncbi:dephospho-CoA kinase [Antiquaquibacter soli]|uniref:Dephospho-CoA kinase n=1 Tax=Antiquaquibacter soli TaxID=3064523 RepID=A0ABT9BLT7_9MICO|nr:dephospho-CoA kinase [Protaetiibacter sp. WY-16]MDO7881971.1 dephospho-CoA kinase [Protaetiibacter sp. WY-16]
MYLIGLTGGIASGKSVVTQRLASHGAVVVDADVLAREVVQPGQPALEDIVRAFGPGMLQPDGTLDRAALGALIFTDPDRRAELNRITHPRIRERAGELIREAAVRDPDAVIVHDVPLLAETVGHWPFEYDLVVVVEASTETRLRRLVELRGMTRQEAQHRVGSQATDAERLAIADVVIDSDGALDDTLRQADELWAMAAASAVSKRPE